MALWLFANGYPSLFGLYVPTLALKRFSFKFIVSFFFIFSVFFSGYSDMDATMSIVSPEALTSRSMVIVLLSTLITLCLLRLFSIRGSAVYAVLGALTASAMVRTGGAGFVTDLLSSAVTALLLSFLISLIISLILKYTVARSDIHLIRLSHYMRYVVIVSIALTAIALGFNWGGFMTATASLITSSVNVFLVTSAVIFAIMLIVSPFLKVESDNSAGVYYDFTIYSVLSVGLAVALTMLFFSFDATTSLLGLMPMPLSVGSLVMAAIAGSSLAQRSRLMELEEYAKEGVSLLASPLVSFLITYIILRMTGKGANSQIVDFSVILAALILIASMSFAAYIRHHRRQREATERLVHSQQQQIYENSRALNDMELKVILSENQALHNSVEMKRQEVMNVALSMVEQRQYLESLNELVKKISKAEDARLKDSLISELSLSLKHRMSYDRDVDSQYFYAQAESLHEDFNAKLAKNFPDMTQQEIRLATLLRLGFSSKYISTLLNITPKSVEISRYRLRQKLGLERGDNLVNYIKSI